MIAFYYAIVTLMFCGPLTVVADGDVTSVGAEGGAGSDVGIIASHREGTAVSPITKRKLQHPMKETGGTGATSADDDTNRILQARQVPPPRNDNCETASSILPSSLPFRSTGTTLGSRVDFDTAPSNFDTCTSGK